MIRIKKIIATALIVCMLCCTLSGCVDFKKANEDNTITINMRSSLTSHIMKALEEKFPDINFVVNEYSGANTSRYHKELLQRGQGGDIFFYTTFYNDKDVDKYLVNLSGYPFLGNFDKAILSTLDVNGAIYQIPGPINVRYVAVNKTLFEEKGWKIPENFDEVVAVCKQIRKEEPEITPLGIGAEGMGFMWSLVTSYAQMGFLDTAEGRAAEQGFRKGTVSFGDAFDEGLDMVGQLIDAGAFMPDKFIRTWDITPKQMGDREVAMCYIMSPGVFHTELLSGEAKEESIFGKYDDEFVALPLYGKNKKNKGLILGTTNTWGINKSLEEKGNEKKLENALRILEYISSEEGQLAIRSDPASIPAIKDLNTDDIPEFMRDLWNDSTNSIKSFFLYTGYEHIIIETGQVLVDAMREGSSDGMKEKFVSIADKLNSEFLNNQSSSFSFGYAEDDLSVEQTREVSCEAFRTVAGADIAIASEGGRKNGTINGIGLAGRLFKGDIVGESLTVIVALKNTNVVSLLMTGKEIREMLESGKVIDNDYGAPESFTYWASGVDVVKKDGRIISIKINDKEIDDAAMYKVAMLNGDYSEEFARNHEITDTGVDILDALGNYFKSQGTIKVDR